MRAVLRLGIAVAAAGLFLGRAPALAQSTEPPAAETPATDAVGPRELQNFNLQGTVTRPAEPAPAPRAGNRAPSPTESAAAPTAPSQPAVARETRTASSETPRREPRAPVSDARETSPPPRAAQPPAASQPAPASALPAAAPGFASEPEIAPATLAPNQGFPIWPWLIAAIMLGAGGTFLFWRRNMRRSYAGGPQADAYVAPEPAPAPRTPAPAPKPVVAPAPVPADPQPVGVVSTRLRPWIEIGFEPLRCIIEKERVIFEFELELLNSGNTPARGVLTRANMINAGPTQDQDIAAFFANPVNEGERIDIILPLQRVQVRHELSMSTSELRVLEAAGRRFFVPLIAFTTLYERGGKWGQTSAAYLMGRDAKGEKMAPFRLDLGPRIFRGLKATPLPISVRT